MFLRNEKILRRETTGLLIIDIQEKILPVVVNPDMVVNNSVKLIRGFNILQIPVLYTEQYPKGLGSTHKTIRDELIKSKLYIKMSFSCFGAEGLFSYLTNQNVSQIVVAGIESHVCVQQTVLDLLANGFRVNVAADAVSSRKEVDYSISLERMRANGAEITTTESILFELVTVSGTDEFRKISALIK
ncbi:MAG: hydrolase [Ignavibacteriaceae bacterium]